MELDRQCTAAGEGRETRKNYPGTETWFRLCMTSTALAGTKTVIYGEISDTERLSSV